MEDKDYSQFKNPYGEKGRQTTLEMNEHHRELTEWALSNVPLTECNKALDIGCGGGMLISILGARYNNAIIDGIDISEESLKVTAETNRKLIDEGRCKLTNASVSNLPFNDKSFDLATAVETYFFWPEIEVGIRETARVVKDNGYLMIAAESYPHPDFKERNDKYIHLTGMNLIENNDMCQIIKSLGFDVVVTTVIEKNWVVFVGKKVTSF